MENLFRLADPEDFFSRRCIWVNGPVIVGAGPSGLATAACLREQGVPYVVLERADCIASFWQKRSYDRLKLHLPKQFCQLPKFPFPEHYPEYPSKKLFVEYLEQYAEKFEIKPQFNECVQSARYDETSGLWRVKTVSTSRTEFEYICRWLVVATGENAERVMPDVEGLGDFGGDVMHVCEYKSGEKFKGKKVLVVGCGNSGMEVSLDLCNHSASPSLVLRSSVHVLPREVLGKSTFELAVLMMKWLPLWLVDKLLLFIAWLVFGNIEKFGLKRPSIGPLQLKNNEGKTPVLDIGALEKIRSGDIKVVPGVKRFTRGQVELVNGEKLDVDAVIMATGYRSNVPSWLQEGEFLCRSVVSYTHPLMTRVANLRASRGDLPGLERAELIEKQLERGLWRFMCSVGSNLVENFAWREISYWELYNAVFEIKELLRLLGDLSRMDSGAKIAAWVWENYQNVLKISKSLFTRLLKVLHKSEEYREVAEMVEREVEEGGLLRDFLELWSNDSKDLIKVWKGNAGLYAVGFTRRGLSGASSDAMKIAQDIGMVWKKETKQNKKRTTACHRRCISQF